MTVNREERRKSLYLCLRSDRNVKRTALILPDICEHNLKAGYSTDTTSGLRIPASTACNATMCRQSCPTMHAWWCLQTGTGIALCSPSAIDSAIENTSSGSNAGKLPTAYYFNICDFTIVSPMTFLYSLHVSESSSLYSTLSLVMKVRLPLTKPPWFMRAWNTCTSSKANWNQMSWTSVVGRTHPVKPMKQAFRSLK